MVLRLIIKDAIISRGHKINHIQKAIFSLKPDSIKSRFDRQSLFTFRRHLCSFFQKKLCPWIHDQFLLSIPQGFALIFNIDFTIHSAGIALRFQIYFQYKFKGHFYPFFPDPFHRALPSYSRSILLFIQQSLPSESRFIFSTNSKGIFNLFSSRKCALELMINFYFPLHRTLPLYPRLILLFIQQALSSDSRFIFSANSKGPKFR